MALAWQCDWLYPVKLMLKIRGEVPKSSWAGCFGKAQAMGAKARKSAVVAVPICIVLC